MAGGLVAVVARLGDHEPVLWALAFASYGVGDTVTTYLGLSLGRAAEAGPIAAPVVGTYGIVGLLVLKVVTLLTFYLSWTVLDTSARVAVPLAVTVVGVSVTAWNLAVIFG